MSSLEFFGNLLGSISQLKSPSISVSTPSLADCSRMLSKLALNASKSALGGL